MGTDGTLCIKSWYARLHCEFGWWERRQKSNDSFKNDGSQLYSSHI